MNQKFHLVPGTTYAVENTRFNNDSIYLGKKCHLKFIKAFPCFDARIHGASNPDDYICYKFTMIPDERGEANFYQFQLIGCEPIQITITMDQNVEATYEPTSDIFKLFRSKLEKYANENDIYDEFFGENSTVNTVGMIQDCINHVFTVMDDNRISEQNSVRGFH